MFADPQSPMRLRQLAEQPDLPWLTVVDGVVDGLPADLRAGRLCDVADPNLRAAYRLFTGAAPLDGTEFLIDAAGWLRASWRPGELPAWTDPAVLRARVEQLAVGPAAPPPTPMHMHHHCASEAASMGSIWRIVVGMAALLGMASGADAHAFLDHARPAVGSSMAAAPPELRLWFTQALEPAFSTVEVVGPSGERVDQGPSQVGTDDPTRLSVGLKPLAPGRYRVIWRVLSVDSHVTNGDFSFAVGP